MNKKQICSFGVCVALVIGVLACSDEGEKPGCDTFSPADSVCFCTKYPEDVACVEEPTTFSIDLHTDEVVALTPHSANGTIWCKGFSIGSSIYVIDRQSESPHPFWKFDIEGSGSWQALADFPGTRYGLTGSADGKGYASSYASNKFWQYDPASNEWTPLDDLPFSPGETHWVEYKGKYYVPNHTGIYEFNPTNKEWTKYSEQTLSGFGALFLLGDDMYWWNVNDDQMKRFNFVTKALEVHDLPDGFNKSVTFNNPFVLDNTAYLVDFKTLWIFDSETKTWSGNDEIITSGSSYVDDVFVLGGKAYIIDDGRVRVFGTVE